MLKYLAMFVFLATLAACQSQRITMTETQIPQDAVPTEVVKEVQTLELLDLPVQENDFATDVQTQNQMIQPPVVESEMSVDSAVEEPLAK